MPGRLTVPLLFVVDRHARWKPGQLRTFVRRIWPEAAHDFSRAGVDFRTREVPGEILRYPSGRPMFKGVQRGVLNLVLTAFTPLSWDAGRAVAGTAARYEGFDICLVALDQAHPNQIPYVSVNTCTHELLHVLLDDTRTARPGGWRGSVRESRIDAVATNLWLFGEGDTVRDGAARWLARTGNRT